MKTHQSFRALGEKPKMNLAKLCCDLRALPEIKSKQAIRIAAAHSDLSSVNGDALYAQPGDDCAAIPVENGYQLIAMEGMLPEFVAQDPKAAAWSAVMANVSDIAAMGGRATAVVNAYWHQDAEQSDELLKSIKHACNTFRILFAGGHSSIHEQYTPALAVAIVGHAKRLLSCHHIRSGQRLFLLSDPTGSWHGNLPYWDCTKGKTPEAIYQQWQVLAELAEAELVVAAKDVSNGGILGTLIMMLELTACGTTLDLNALTVPDLPCQLKKKPVLTRSHRAHDIAKIDEGANLLQWLRAFQSFGFLLAVDPDKVPALIRYFQKSHLECMPIGTVNDSATIRLDYQGQQEIFWDFNQQELTGMGSFASATNK